MVIKADTHSRAFWARGPLYQHSLQKGRERGRLRSGAQPSFQTGSATVHRFTRVSQEVSRGLLGLMGSGLCWENTLTLHFKSPQTPASDQRPTDSPQTQLLSFFAVYLKSIQLPKGRMDPRPRHPGTQVKDKEKARRAEGSQASCLSQQGLRVVRPPA